MFKFILATVVGVLVALSCGKTQLNYGGPAPQVDAAITPANSVKASRQGVLELSENEIAKSGIVEYSIYEDGSVAYEGVVTFLGRKSAKWEWDFTTNNSYNYAFLLSELAGEISQSFRGAIKAQVLTVQSKSYSKIGDSTQDKELQFKVNDVDKNIREVKANFSSFPRRPYPDEGSPTDQNATGIIKIDVSEDLIDIIEIRAQGQVFNREVELRLVKRGAAD